MLLCCTDLAKHAVWWKLFQLCVERGLRRAYKTGRYLDEGFLQKNYDIMFPDINEGPLPEDLSGGGKGRQHYDKFEAELKSGDERFLFDNVCLSF